MRVRRPCIVSRLGPALAPQRGLGSRNVQSDQRLQQDTVTPYAQQADSISSKVYKPHMFTKLGHFMYGSHLVCSKVM